MVGSRQGIGRVVVFLGSACAAGSPAFASTCDKAEFEVVVAEAANVLRDLNQKNKPVFQGRLKDLMDKRRWSHDQFLKEAAPLVQDAKIAEFDERSARYLEKIQHEYEHEIRIFQKVD